MPALALGRLRLAGEFAGVFVGLPGLYALGVVRVPLFLALLVMASTCAVVLVRDRTFDLRQFWNFGAARARLGAIAWGFLLLGAALVGVVLYFDSEKFLGLVRENPRLWLVIMVFYPLLSVYPQEIIYRTFLLHRYRLLFRSDWSRIAASAGAFAFAHVMFKEWWIATGLTLIGGAMFAWTYLRTRSTMAAVLEHALFGCFLFTIGLGEYFYLGAAR
jgi:membrane protease YdiL (CAAX protease family)